jgi:FtsP/CotA-like multicopper oxidase with cupredoxin domain
MFTRRAAIAGFATTVVSLSQRGLAQSGQTPAPEANGGVLPAAVTARPMSRRLRPEATKDADVFTFNGELSPAFRIRHGTELRLAIQNDTPKPLSLHFQGVRGPNAMDGVGGLTQEPVAPGQKFEYRFTPPDAGTFLIRPCVLSGSAEPLERGLSALLIIDEQDPPKVDRDLAVMIDDWSLNEDGSLAPFDEASARNPAGRLGSWLGINGHGTPRRVEAPQGARVRLRLANACNARTMRLRFDGLKPYVVAVDGQPTGTFEPLKASLPFAPGTRYDLLVDLPLDPGSGGTVTAVIGNGIPLLELVTTGDKRPALPKIAPLVPNRKLPEAIKLQDASRKDVLLAAPADSKAPWTINGAPGDAAAAPLLKVRRGTPVVLALINKSPFVQPLHLHGHAFRLLHTLDDGWEPYFLDTVLVPESRTVRIAFVADNPGKWLLASTVMERFDGGLWTWIEVT